MIDLEKRVEEYRSLVRDTLLRFEAKHESVKWSAYAFDAAPVYGFLRLNFDTAKNSDEILERYPDWFKEDSAGKFNDNCADFKFGAFVEFEVPGWEEEFFQNYENFEYIDSSGKRHKVNMEEYGNEGFNKIVFDLLVKVIELEVEWVRKNSRCKDLPSRFGVQMCDSQYVHYLLL